MISGSPAPVAASSDALTTDDSVLSDVVSTDNSASLGKTKIPFQSALVHTSNSSLPVAAPSSRQLARDVGSSRGGGTVVYWVIHSFDHSFNHISPKVTTP